jgi:hypothetical protein
MEQIRAEVNAAPRGQKAVVVARWAEVLKVDRATVYTLLRVPGGRTRKAGAKSRELVAWATVAAVYKKSPPPGAGEISTDQAVRLAVQNGDLPAGALEVPVATINRTIRALGLAPQARRRNRIQAGYPNRRHHFDASSSKFLYVARDLGGGDYLLKLHRPGQMGYKNKPIPVERLRPWVYGVTDDYSGRLIVRYTVAHGESLVDSLSFLAHAWERMGLPEDLLADQGILKKGFASADLIARLDVGLPESLPYAKEAHGKIERPWRTLWQRLEKPMFAGDWKKFELKLSELHVMTENYLAEYNAMPHRFEREISRMDAWEKINWRGGLVALPEDALATVARRKKRKVDVAGWFEYQGKAYEVAGLHNAWVYVYEGVFGDRLAVQDIKTGTRYNASAPRILDVDEFRAHPETPHDRAVKEAATLDVPRAAMLYQSAPEARAESAALKAPARVKAVREIEDPLDASVHPTVEEAYREFAGIVGAFIPEDMREEVMAEIESNGRDREFVRMFALDVRAAMEQQVAVNG